jgi:hypothetical protein
MRMDMVDFERSTTVGVDADRAFAFLADPLRVPDYVPMVTLVDSTAVDGELDAEADLHERGGASGARFFADRDSRRVEWGRSGTEYVGSIEVAEGTRSTSQVTIRLHTRADADAAEINRVLDEVLRNLRRLLSGR